MKKLLLALVPLTFVFPVQAEETIRMNVNLVCSNLVGIPYASDNFSDKEWEKFKKCVSFFKQYDAVYTN